MSRRLSGPSKSTLSETLDRRLRMYSLAASAAGIGMFALAQPADAEVVVTPKNLTVVAGAPAYIEMTGEGKADFELLANNSYGRKFVELVSLPPDDVLGVVGGPITSHGDFLAGRLTPGAVVGPLVNFGGGVGGAFLAASSTYWRSIYIGSSVWYPIRYTSAWGLWPANASTAYLGVKFPVAGRLHYGWIRLAVTNWSPVTAHITAYAYETEPDTPLIVPPASSDDADPNTVQEDHSLGKAAVGGPSLGMLALGAHGLPLWRREETLAY
jgi:hypothetical protein